MRIEPLLPNDASGIPRVDDRRVLSGIVHPLTSGRRWEDCPEHVYRPKKTLYSRFRRWAKRDVNAVPPSQYLFASKGYASNALRFWLLERATNPFIPSKSNRKVQIEHDRQIFRQRNVVECVFCRFKDWRRVATRFDRNIKTFTATIAAFVTW